MASTEKKEIEKHLQIALKEIGEIKPWFSKDFNAWVFSHALYPVEYSGDSSEEVKQNYPLYLKEFIKHRLQNRLAPLMEKKTKGWGGLRKSAGRPLGSMGIQKRRMYIPYDLVDFLKDPKNLDEVRRLKSK